MQDGDNDVRFHLHGSTRLRTPDQVGYPAGFCSKNATGRDASCNSFAAIRRNRSRTHEETPSPARSAASLNACFSAGPNRISRNSLFPTSESLAVRPRLFDLGFMILIVPTSSGQSKSQNTFSGIDVSGHCPYNWRREQTFVLLEAVMNAREDRGLVIANTSKITCKGSTWFVPSQNSGGSYAVRLNPDRPTCTCADYELREMKCKHIFAVEITRKRYMNLDGSTTETQIVTVTETVKKPTYTQDWPAYNAAQTNEKDKFQVLLADLCRGIIDETPRTKGQPRIPLADAIFSAVFKVYSTVSGRRFASDLREAEQRGYIAKAPHYNSIFNYLENPAITPILQQLITESSLPLKSVERDFACDSSGFMTSRFIKWFDQKYGVERTKTEWVKTHIMCGVKTNVVTAVEIHDRYTGDAPLLPTLTQATAKNFNMREVSADKGYSSYENHEAIEAVGATPFISFKLNAKARQGGLFEKMYHYFSFRREDFLRHYHKRSNVESTFSMMKAKFGDAVRSKTDVAMKNEVLAKVLCHNIVVVIHEMYELGIEPTFWGQTAPSNS
jgi:transposase